MRILAKITNTFIATAFLIASAALCATFSLYLLLQAI